MILLLYYVEAKLCIRLQAHKKEEARSTEKIKGFETFLLIANHFCEKIKGFEIYVKIYFVFSIFFKKNLLIANHFCF
jgi:hypothetical protein